MRVEDILDDLPTTPHERAEVVAGLVEMIERLNATILRHQMRPDPDLFTIEQFTERRNKYVGQLAVVLNLYGVIVLPGAIPLPTLPTTGTQVAA